MNEQEHIQSLRLLRTTETATAYAQAKATERPPEGCRLCADPATIREYEHWRIMPNRFPYDRYYERSDMLVLKRHARESELTDAERTELCSLKEGALGEQYDQLLENLPHKQSIPHHCHLHLVTIRPPAPDTAS